MPLIRCFYDKNQFVCSIPLYFFDAHGMFAGAPPPIDDLLISSTKQTVNYFSPSVLYKAK